MNAPRIIVTGAGRSGTKSAAVMFQNAGYDAAHEPFNAVTLQVAREFAHGNFTTGQVMAVLDAEIGDWPEVVCDFTFAALCVAVMDDWTDTTLIGLTRNPYDSVRSMRNRAWYQHDDDWESPNIQSKYEAVGDERIIRRVFVPYRGARIRGDLYGDMSSIEWLALSPEKRCLWWWAWANRNIHNTVKRHADRSHWIRLEDVAADPGLFGDLLDDSRLVFPHENQSDVGLTQTEIDSMLGPVLSELGY